MSVHNTTSLLQYTQWCKAKRSFLTSTKRLAKFIWRHKKGTSRALTHCKVLYHFMPFIKQSTETDLLNFPFQQLLVSKAELKALCDYYFDGKGKAFRPMIVILMARACNVHSNKEGWESTSALCVYSYCDASVSVNKADLMSSGFCCRRSAPSLWSLRWSTLPAWCMTTLLMIRTQDVAKTPLIKSGEREEWVTHLIVK